MWALSFCACGLFSHICELSRGGLIPHGWGEKEKENGIARPSFMDRSNLIFPFAKKKKNRNGVTSNMDQTIGASFFPSQTTGTSFYVLSQEK